MNIFINILVPIICLLIGYLFGSIQISIIVGKRVFHVDIRELGSGNAGATNATRLWGKKWGWFITIFDVAKTILPMIICWAILTFVPFGEKPLMPTSMQFYSDDISTFVIQWPCYYLAAIGVVLGHCFPLFDGFKGGKGAASFVGAAAISSWLFGLGGVLFYEIMKKKTKIVSLSVLVCGLVFTLLSWIFTILCLTHVIPENLYWLPTYSPYFVNVVLYQPLMMTINYIIVAVRHKGNIQRLIAGTERKVK